MKHPIALVALGVTFWLAISIAARATETPAPAGNGSVPRIVEKDDRHALLVDGQPFFILGGQAHNSSAWPGMLPRVWAAVEAMHANTLEIPIYWEQIEPQPGKYDFSVVDLILKEAREMPPMPPGWRQLHRNTPWWAP